MSRERARRREQREREAAVRAAARAAEAERRERSLRRHQALRSWLPTPRRRPAGLLEQRRRRRLRTTALLLLALNVAVWLLSDSWGLRLLVAAVTPLAAPVLHTLLFRR